MIPCLAVGLLVFLLVVFVYALAAHLQVMDRWLERPYLLVFPSSARSPPPSSREASADGATASLPHGRADLRRGLRHARDLVLALHDPVRDHDRRSAAPHSSLAFMFWGEGLFVFPLMLVYAAVSYSVFRGKIRPMAEHY